MKNQPLFWPVKCCISPRTQHSPGPEQYPSKLSIPLRTVASSPGVSILSQNLRPEPSPLGLSISFKTTASSRTTESFQDHNILSRISSAEG